MKNKSDSGRRVERIQAATAAFIQTDVKPVSLEEALTRLSNVIGDAETAVASLTAKAQLVLRPVPEDQMLNAATLGCAKLDAPVVCVQLEYEARMLKLLAAVRELDQRLPV